MRKPASWIQAIEPQLKNLIDLPEESFSFPFSFDTLTAFFTSQLGLEGLSFTLGTVEWRVERQFFTGLASPVALSLQASPLHGGVSWIMPYEDINRLISWIQDKNGKALELDNPELIKGAYRYLVLIAMEGLSKTELLQSFSWKLTKEMQWDEQAYTIDVGIRYKESQVWGRLLISPAFKASLAKFFSKEHLSLADLAKQFPHLKVPLSVVNGSVEFSAEELQSLQVGDFVLIDNAFFRPSDDKGSLKILIEDKPLFQVKLKEGKFKILDFLHSYEEANV